MHDAATEEIRYLHKKVAAADRRIAMQALPGKVVEVDPDKRRLRLRIGTTSKGEPILGPWVRWEEAAAGGARIHSEPAIGEQMVLSSQSGTVGPASIARPGTYDKDHDAPSKSSTVTVIERGGDRIEIGGGAIRFISPKIVSDGETHLGGEGGQLLHRKGDADSDGDVAIGSATRVYAV